MDEEEEEVYEEGEIAEKEDSEADDAIPTDVLFGERGRRFRQRYHHQPP